MHEEFETPSINPEEFIVHLVNTRGRGRQRIIDSATRTGISRRVAERIVDAAILKNLQYSRATARTDVERFRHAAAQLRQKGIGLYERQFYTINEAFDRMPDEAERDGMWGYLYFSDEEVSSSLQTGYIPLTFSLGTSALNEENFEDREQEMAEMTIKALRDAGLTVTWSGSVTNNILVYMRWIERWREIPNIAPQLQAQERK